MLRSDRLTCALWAVWVKRKGAALGLTQVAVDIVENPALQNNGILTQARLEELISI